MNFLSVTSTTPQQLIEAALGLHNHAVETNKLKDGSKVYPQVNAERALYAWAALSLYGERRDLTPAEKATVSEVANAYQTGFQELWGGILNNAPEVRAAMYTPEWNEAGFLFRTKLVLPYKDKAYRIYITRRLVMGELVTSICFVEYSGATDRITPKEPAKPKLASDSAVVQTAEEAIFGTEEIENAL